MDESITKHLEQPAKTLKLSEAIRIGSKIRPQCTGAMFENGRSCALGAAYEAISGSYVDGLENHGPVLGFLTNYFNNCFLTSTVGFKNDYGWTREAIADWLESQGL